MKGIIKMVITEDERVLEISEEKPGKLNIFVGEDVQDGVGHDIEVDTDEFLRLLNRVITQEG